MSPSRHHFLTTLLLTTALGLSNACCCIEDNSTSQVCCSSRCSCCSEMRVDECLVRNTDGSFANCIGADCDCIVGGYVDYDDVITANSMMRSDIGRTSFVIAAALVCCFVAVVTAYVVRKTR